MYTVLTYLSSLFPIIEIKSPAMFMNRWFMFMRGLWLVVGFGVLIACRICCRLLHAIIDDPDGKKSREFSKILNFLRINIMEVSVEFKQEIEDLLVLAKEYVSFFNIFRDDIYKQACNCATCDYEHSTLRNSNTF